MNLFVLLQISGGLNYLNLIQTNGLKKVKVHCGQMGWWLGLAHLVGRPFQREAHHEQRSLADDAGWRCPANFSSPAMRPAGKRRLELHDGLVNRFGKGREDGSSPGVLSTVAWVGLRGTVAVVQTRGRHHRLAGRRGSGHHWGPRGCETKGGRRQRQRRRPPLSEGTRRSLGASVRTVRLTGGPHAVLIFFQFIQNWLNFKNSKWVSYLATKIPNFCMRITWDIMNNFLNCANIQFLT
jgi:hypothetical protein